MAAKYAGYMFQNKLCSQTKTKSREHTVIHVFARFTITKRIAGSIDVDTQISDSFPMGWHLTYCCQLDLIAQA